MRLIQWCRTPSIALAIAASAISTHSAVAESPISGRLENIDVSYLDVLNLGSFSQVQQVSDEEPVAEEAAEAAQEPAPLTDGEGVESAAPMPAYAQTAPVAYCNRVCCTKEKKAAATAAMKGAFKGLFYANDFSYLNDPCYNGKCWPGECLKGLCCGCNTVDVGAEARVRYHDERNHRGLGLTGNDDSFWLTRYRMYANWRVSDLIRVYGEYLYADSSGEEFAPRPIEENRNEIQNLFVDAKLTDCLTVRLGRQELLYGAQRLISPLDWANTRRTFDGYRFLYNSKDWALDGFYTNPVNRIPANVDRIDDTNDDVHFYGLYGTRKGLRCGDLDVYYLGLTNDVLEFDYHTIGTRISGATDTFLYELEGGVQFGSNSPGFGDHGAGFVTGGFGKQFNICTCCGVWKPTLVGTFML